MVKRAYCVTWRTPSMAAPAFCYYANRAAAQAVADGLASRGYISGPSETWVSAATPLLDEVEGFARPVAATGYYVEWQTPTMPAPTLWYFTTEAAAWRAFRQLLEPGYRLHSPRPCLLPDGAAVLDR